jgi:gliding motility-associated-like protein
VGLLPLQYFVVNQRIVRPFLFLFALGFFQGNLPGQNLIANGGFEEIECPENPINSITVTPNWYVTGADAYWMHWDCPLDPLVVQSVAAIDLGLLPNSGNGYISFESSILQNGFFISEGIGTTLAEPLEGERYYLLEYAYLYYPRTPSPDHPGIDCGPLPEQAISVYTAYEEIDGTYTYAYPDFGFPYLAEVSINGALQLLNEGSAREDFIFREWFDYWDCFQAAGGETDLAIVGNNLEIQATSACFEAENSTNIYFEGFAIDDVRLFLLPERLDTLILLCDQLATVDLDDLIPTPLIGKATLLWEDGTTSSIRSFSNPGFYEAALQLPCTTIPISIEVDEDLCQVAVYVPNAFSPNFDGVNDRLGPFVDAQLPIQNFLFRVYDRWGNLLFQTEDPIATWDGTFRGQRLGAGVYSWILEFTLVDGQNMPIRKSGDVVLLP